MLVSNSWAGVSMAARVVLKANGILRIRWCIAADWSNYSLLFGICEMGSRVLSPVLGSPVPRRWWQTGEGQVERHWDGWGDRDVMKSLGEEHLFILSLSRLRRYPTAIFRYLMGDWKRDRTKFFSEVLSGNRWRCSKGNSGCLAIKKKYFTRSGAASEHGPREVMEYPSLETLKAQLDTALSNLLYIWSWPCCEQEVGPDDLQRKGPFSPKFFYDSNVPHDMCAKILSALNISSLVSGIINTFISWNAAELTQILYILSKCN